MFGHLLLVLMRLIIAHRYVHVPTQEIPPQSTFPPLLEPTTSVKQAPPLFKQVKCSRAVTPSGMVWAVGTVAAVVRSTPHRGSKDNFLLLVLAILK